MLKRLFDMIASFVGLIVTSPILLPILWLIYRQDKHSPFYVAPRVGKNGTMFNMLKLRSMVVNADSTGVDSTSANDNRITPIGQFVRSYKLDELTQLWNVLIGDMSLVGPRPNVKRETDLYTNVEKLLLTVQPGITDLASIVFSDEGDILKDKADPDLSYNQLIRPWKSRLGLLYLQKQSLWLDIQILFLTVIALFSRRTALEGVEKLLMRLYAGNELVEIARREKELTPFAPPGALEPVTSR